MAKITIQTIIDKFRLPEWRVEQIDNEQLFVVETEKATLLVSYLTIVGILQGNVWFLTDTKYSPTTSKQLTQFARGRIVKRCNITDMLEKVGYRYG